MYLFGSCPISRKCTWYRIRDRHLLQSGSQLLRHQAGILIGSVCRTKARHRHCNDILAVLSMPVSNAFAVTSSASVESKPPEIPTTAVLAVSMHQTLLQSHCLDHQNLLTALFPLCHILWNKRGLCKASGKCCLFHTYVEQYFWKMTFFRCLESCIFSPFT